jgi:EmrB/QacA subfamily drug resistance transporter
MVHSVDMPRRSNVLLAIVCLAQFMVVLDVSIVNVALPSIRSDLHFSTTGLQWVVNAYTLTFAGFLMLGGRASDLLGRRRMFLVGTGVFALASLLCAAASSQGLLVGARAVQGIGGAVVSPATLAVITTSFPEGLERNRALGVWAATAGLGASAGVLLGGVLTESVSWQSIFLVNVPIGIGLVAAGRAVIAEGRRDGARHFDVAGAVLITLGLVGLVYGIVRSDALGWGSPGVLGPIAVGLATLALFALVEQRVARAPLVPLAVFRRAQLSAANLVVLLLYAAMFSMFFFVTLYLQQVLHYSALGAGAAFLPTTLGIAAASSLAPRAIARLGPRHTMTLGMLLVAVGLAWYSGLGPDSSYLAAVIPGSVAVAAGVGLALVSATIVAVQGVPPSESGLASGLLNSARLMGGALGLAALSTVAASSTHAALAAGSGPAQALTDGYGSALRAGAIVCVVGAAVAAAVIRPRARVANQAPAAAVERA